MVLEWRFKKKMTRGENKERNKRQKKKRRGCKVKRRCRGGAHRSLPWQRKTRCFLRSLDLEELEMKAVPSVRKNQACMKTHLLVLLAERF